MAIVSANTLTGTPRMWFTDFLGVFQPNAVVIRIDHHITLEPQTQDFSPSAQKINADDHVWENTYFGNACINCANN